MPRRGASIPVTPGLCLRKSMAGLATLSLSLPVSLYAQQNTEIQQAISLGAYTARGDYGEAVDTRIRYFPLTYELDYGKWGFQLLVPRLEVTGLGNVLINIGGVTQSVASDEVTTSRGMGDSIASLIYRFDPLSANAPFIDFRLDVKIPTADERKALGTGEFDYSMQLDFSKALGKSALFATAGYNVRGKSDLYAGLKNSFFAQLGFATPLTEAVSAGAFYDYRQSASEFSRETHELVPYLSWQINDSWSFTGLTIWGFTDASADTTFMGQLRYSW